MNLAWQRQLCKCRRDVHFEKRKDPSVIPDSNRPGRALCWNVAVLPLQVCLLLEGLQPGAGSCSPLLSAVGMETVSHTGSLTSFRLCGL